MAVVVEMPGGRDAEKRAAGDSQLQLATIGMGNIGGGVASVEEVLAGAERWLGRGATEVEPGVYQSADRLNQFRMKTGDLTGAHGNIGPHVHFESLAPDG